MDHLGDLRVFIAIAALEQRLGARLFNRSTRSVHLTGIGERFLDDCRRIVAELAEAEAAVGGAHTVPHGQLAITASSMFPGARGLGRRAQGTGEGARVRRFRGRTLAARAGADE